jgi:hypothetical protein
MSKAVSILLKILSSAMADKDKEKNKIAIKDFMINLNSAKTKLFAKLDEGSPKSWRRPVGAPPPLHYEFASDR